MTTKQEIVRHPAGGFTLAVPIAPDSTARIYVGRWDLAPRRATRRRTAAQKFNRSACR